MVIAHAMAPLRIGYEAPRLRVVARIEKELVAMQKPQRLTTSGGGSSVERDPLAAAMSDRYPTARTASRGEASRRVLLGTSQP